VLKIQVKSIEKQSNVNSTNIKRHIIEIFKIALKINENS